MREFRIAILCNDSLDNQADIYRITNDLSEYQADIKPLAEGAMRDVIDRALTHDPRNECTVRCSLAHLQM